MSSPERILDRCDALRRAPEQATAADVEGLVECFDHPLKAVQRGAATGVIAIAGTGRDVLSVLERAMASDSPRRRWVAAWAAGHIPGSRSAPMLPVLLDALGVDDGDVRWAAARILTGREERDEVARRLRALVGCGAAAQRKMALYCLRDLAQTDAEAVARYREALHDEAAGVRLAAMSALARVRPAAGADARRIAALLRDADGGVRRAAAATLGRLGVSDDAVRVALLQAAHDDDPVLARLAGEAVGRLG